MVADHYGQIFQEVLHKECKMVTFYGRTIVKIKMVVNGWTDSEWVMSVDGECDEDKDGSEWVDGQRLGYEC
jgi:hypothetical protein